MPALGNALDFAKYEAKNLRAHQLGTAPSSPVTGQLYYNNTSTPGILYWYDGTQWVSATGGVPPDATTSSKGVIQLSGDLAGSAVSPQIAAGVIVDADVNSGASIAESKLNLATDAAVGTGSRRTLGFGAQQAMPGNTTLNAITAPVSNVSIAGNKLTQVGDPTANTDGANKQYVDNVAQGLNAKASVRAASTANIATLSGLLTLDSYTAVAGDRLLVKDQLTPAQNGIYIAASGAWSRATDADTFAENVSAYVWVEQGNTQADSGWLCIADAGGTLGSSALNWVQFSGAGQITAGAGLTKSGNTLNVGQGSGVTVAADTIAVDATVARYYSNAATHGAGTTITIPQATHGLRSSRALHVQVQDNATGNIEFPDISVAANGDVTITYGAALTANTKLVTIIG